ncbi:hypothetical protein H6P81_015758 [Aristolochia fimbriata]|uniref:Uncharacterized protein n=1 Tax=Aristolochia fimbriata TaxID=158543 RepID=A0AAV7E6X3_ARIFI|nr:hypothetical protein H6P81_015758 [Aristolochia fimbriata]
MRVAGGKKRERREKKRDEKKREEEGCEEEKAKGERSRTETRVAGGKKRERSRREDEGMKQEGRRGSQEGRQRVTRGRRGSHEGRRGSQDGRRGKKREVEIPTRPGFFSFRFLLNPTPWSSLGRNKKIGHPRVIFLKRVLGHRIRVKIPFGHRIRGGKGDERHRGQEKEVAARGGEGAEGEKEGGVKRWGAKGRGESFVFCACAGG